VSSILVLGGCGEMGSAAVADLVERTGHEVAIGDIRPDAAAALLGRLGAPERVVRVDVDDPASLGAALDGTEVVLNVTYMRHNLPVTDD
jgi:saccharopine dehydrogenase-like NADP-dependent oxidoreductase